MRTGVTPKRIATANIVLSIDASSLSLLLRNSSRSQDRQMPPFALAKLFLYVNIIKSFSRRNRRLTIKQQFNPYFSSLERRWSSRTFRYGYLVTTSPQLSVPPSAASSLRLDHWLRALPTPMVWRAVCTRPGNVFTATCWFAITSDSSFM